MSVIGRPIDMTPSIHQNDYQGLEYLVDTDNRIMTFDNENDAKAFLQEMGYTEQNIADERFVIEDEPQSVTYTEALQEKINSNIFDKIERASAQAVPINIFDTVEQEIYKMAINDFDYLQRNISENSRGDRFKGCGMLFRDAEIVVVNNKHDSAFVGNNHYAVYHKEQLVCNVNVENIYAENDANDHRYLIIEPIAEGVHHPIPSAVLRAVESGFDSRIGARFKETVVIGQDNYELHRMMDDFFYQISNGSPDAGRSGKVIHCEQGDWQIFGWDDDNLKLQASVKRNDSPICDICIDEYAPSGFSDRIFIIPDYRYDKYIDEMIKQIYKAIIDSSNKNNIRPQVIINDEYIPHYFLDGVIDDIRNLKANEQMVLDNGYMNGVSLVITKSADYVPSEEWNNLVSVDFKLNGKIVASVDHLTPVDGLESVLNKLRMPSPMGSITCPVVSRVNTLDNFDNRTLKQFFKKLQAGETHKKNNYDYER